MPQCLQKYLCAVFPPHSYDPRLSSPDRSLKAPGWTMRLVMAILVQMLQLQREATSFMSASTSKRTAPQWQLPECVRVPFGAAFPSCPCVASMVRLLCSFVLSCLERWREASFDSML